MKPTRLAAEGSSFKFRNAFLVSSPFTTLFKGGKVMSFEPGGRADKLGNRYEGRWVIKQFFRLINEEIVSITIEPTGEDEIGVEFWVKHSDGKKRRASMQS